HESGGPTGGTRGGYIDSFENMPGAQSQPFGASPPRAFIPELGVRVTVTAGAEASWLGPGERIEGLVCDRMPGPLPEATVVVKLDRSVEARGRSGRRVTGAWALLDPADSPTRWRSTGSARLEVWASPPSTEPWLDADIGVLADDDATYDFG
ncbi:MAG: hypothetical protein AAGA90_09340, partial [Actinomycetota bacterium]